MHSAIPPLRPVALEKLIAISCVETISWRANADKPQHMLAE
jgi:hypothetical protein